MKKVFSLALLVGLTCLASCKKNSYTITGTVEGAQDGDSVALVSVNGWDMNELQKVAIKDGKFTFEGRQDTAAFLYLAYQGSDERSAMAQFILENADIQVAMNPDSAVADVRGTQANEAWTAFSKANERLNAEGMGYYQTTIDSAAAPEAKAEAQKKLQGVEDKLTQLFKDFVKENVHNLGGQYILAGYADQLEDDAFVEEQLNLITDEEASEGIRQLKELRQLKAATAVGKDFIDIKASTPDGGEASVSQVAAAAKVTMIDFWASWCGPCRAEMPNVKAVYDQFHAQGFDIIGVSLDEDAEAWKKAIADLNTPWTQISDLKGWECAGAAAYGVRAIPATVLIKDGKIVARDVRGEELAPKVAELLK